MQRTLTPAELEAYKIITEYGARVKQADESTTKMLAYMEGLQPNPDTPTESLFEDTPLARLLCSIIEAVEKGKLKRVAVSVGPQFGKSQVLSRGAPAWLSGKKPRRHMILGSYNDTFAEEFGGEVRDIVQSPHHILVFPGYGLKKGSEAKNNLATTQGGKMAFVGVGGSGTGKPADIFFVDDPYKNDTDAQSESYREAVWKWFTSVVFARCHKDSAIIIVHTRWHEDDLIGRLCDPEHPERHKKYKGIAERWTYYNLPAVIEDPDLAKSLGLELKIPTNKYVIEQFGCKPMVSLWENRKSLEFLAEAKQTDSRTFGALYMGKPSPDKGIYFTEDMLVEYQINDLPRYLTKYGASDHAVSEKQTADFNIIGCAGVDANDDIWVLPDLVWDRMETDRVVEELIVQMKAHKPDLWWMESELISKAFGPFLIKQMHQEQVYTTLSPQVPSKEKKVRARSIQGYMSHRKVHFPAFAPWWPMAKQQLLKFPYGTNDDFVDFMSWLGLGLLSEYGAVDKSNKASNIVRVGGIEWVKYAAKAREKRENRDKDKSGW